VRRLSHYARTFSQPSEKRFFAIRFQKRIGIQTFFSSHVIRCESNYTAGTVIAARTRSRISRRGRRVKYTNAGIAGATNVL